MSGPIKLYNRAPLNGSRNTPFPTRIRAEIAIRSCVAKSGFTKSGMDATSSQIQQNNRLSLGKLVFSKKTRVTLAVAFLLVACFTIGIRVLTSASINGVVNAPIVLVQSPIDGVVVSDQLTAGETVDTGDRIFVIKNDRLDTGNIDGVRSEMEQTAAQIDGFLVQIKGYQALRESLQERLKSHLESNEAYLTLKAAEAEGMLRKMQETRDQASRDFERQKVLAGKGADSAQAYDSARTKQKEMTNEVASLEAVLNRTKAELEANRKGVLLDGYSGAPYAQQRLDEVSLRLSEAEASHAREEKRRQALERQLAHEEETVRKLSDATILAPSLCLVQSVRVAKGSDVVKGTVLCELVDCAKSYVEATVPEKLFDEVSVGQDAEVYLYGNSNSIPGKVISVRGAGANNTSNPTMFAAKVFKSTSDSMIVSVGISAADLIKVFGSANQVGRTARIRLSN